MKITATIQTANGNTSKEFNAVLRENGHIYSPDLVEWVKSNKDRVSNYIQITAEGKKYTYSI